MLTFYYNPLSPNARRVWLTLLEKGIDFEPVVMKLDGDQMQPEFLQISPFNHIPVIVDDGLRVIESLAIMDYLEAKYPQPSLLPKELEALAKVRMAQMLTANELFPQVIPLISASEESPKTIQAKQHIDKALIFLSELLGDNAYMGGNHLTLGDIVAGNAVILLNFLDIDLNNYTVIKSWCDRLMQREPWQKTAMSTESFEQFRRRVRVLIRKRMGSMKEQSRV
ncbi:MAG: glutathione S-transferase family protein [Calothrix sp. MO_167.B12]|nr:glutathione S-transferase family protein [Calothrix sp. MO_167.B12]